MDEPIDDPLDDPLDESNQSLEAETGTSESRRVRYEEEVALDDRPLTKRRVSRAPGGFFSETIRRSAQAANEATGGVAEAVGRGFRAYGDSLTDENIMRFSLSNGFLEGMVRGYASFFDEMAAASRRVLDVISQAPEPAPPARPPRARRVTETEVTQSEIDYDRLATLVARKINEKRGGRKTS